MKDYDGRNRDDLHQQLPLLLCVACNKVDAHQQIVYSISRHLIGHLLISNRYDIYAMHSIRICYMNRTTKSLICESICTTEIYIPEIICYRDDQDRDSLH